MVESSKEEVDAASEEVVEFSGEEVDAATKTTADGVVLLMLVDVTSVLLADVVEGLTLLEADTGGARNVELLVVAAGGVNGVYGVDVDVVKTDDCEEMVEGPKSMSQNDGGVVEVVSAVLLSGAASAVL